MQPGPERTHYDVVVVGARVAGAATAMLLARRGLSVLVVDRARSGSDTLSSHALMRGAVRRLADWGLLESVWAADTPVITKVAFTYGNDDTVIDVQPEPGLAGLAAPRRTVLDPIVADGARASGAEILHETRVLRVITDGTGRVSGVLLARGDGTEVAVSADLVVGADGLHSLVARSVGAPVTTRGDHASASTLRYYTDLDVDRSTFAWLFAPGIGGGVIPTNAGAVCVFTGMPPELMRAERRHGIEQVHQQNLDRLNPELAEAVRSATPIGPVRSFPGVPGQFRTPHGPGWALVGDAGYFKDPFAAHGISDAFRDAELLTRAVLSGDFDGYEARRNELSMPLFRVLDRIASYQWDLETLPRLHIELAAAMKDEEQATRLVPKRLLGVWAHPDDEAYLSAGLMARVVDHGGSVTVVTATRGENGTDDPSRFGTEAFAALRWRELTASVAELGVTDVRYLGLADGECHLADDDVMTRRILEVIEETRPEAVITFGPDGITGHPDHRAVSRWTTAAWNRSDRAADLLYAAMTEEFMDRNDELHRRLGLFAEYGAPPQPLPRSAVALGCTLNPDELERKRTALARHASQTTALATAVGEDAYHHWWRDETFRKGPAPTREPRSAGRSDSTATRNSVAQRASSTNRRCS
jgi:flavin-dependent dehydrogenase